MRKARAKSAKVVAISAHTPSGQPDSLPERLICPKMLGLRLGVSRSTINRWCRAGLIGYYRLGPNRIAFSEAHVRDFLQSREVVKAA